MPTKPFSQQNTKTHGILFDIDCIFDTRLSVLKSINPEVADTYLLNGYFYRDRDDFPDIDVYEFRKRYSERNINTLKHSLPTNILMYLKEVITGYLTKSIDQYLPRMELILNIYPYQLSPEEINTFVLGIKYYTNNTLPVRVINTNPLNITPEWLDNNVSLFYLYTWDTWINKYCNLLTRNKLETTIIHAPRIFPLSKQEGLNQLKQLEEESKDLFLTSDDKEIEEAISKALGNDVGEITQSLISQLIGFEFLPTREFCIATPDEMDIPGEETIETI